MANKVFNNAYKDTQVVTASGAVVLWSATSAGDVLRKNDPTNVPLVLTGITIRYGRQATPIDPIASNTASGDTQYLIYGRPTGTLQCTGLLLPGTENSRAQLVEFINAASGSDAECGVATGIYMSVTPFGLCENQSGNTRPLTYLMSGVSLETLDVSIQGGNGGIVLVSNPLTFRITALELNI